MIKNEGLRPNYTRVSAIEYKRIQVAVRESQRAVGPQLQTESMPVSILRKPTRPKRRCQASPPGLGCHPIEPTSLHRTNLRSKRETAGGTDQHTKANEIRVVT